MDTLSRICTLSDSGHGLAVRRELAALGAAVLTAQLVVAEDTAEPLRCKAANALGSLAMAPEVAQQLLPKVGTTAWMTVGRRAGAGAPPSPERLLAALKCMLDSDSAYAQADACMAMGWLIKSCDGSWVDRLAIASHRALSLLEAAAPRFNNGIERVDNLATFALVLLHNLAARGHHDFGLHGALPIVCTPTLSRAVLAIAEKADSSLLLVACDTLHIVAQLAGGRAVLLEARAVATLGRLQRAHPDLQPVLRAVIGAIITSNTSTSNTSTSNARSSTSKVWHDPSLPAARS